MPAWPLCPTDRSIRDGNNSGTAVTAVLDCDFELVVPLTVKNQQLLTAVLPATVACRRSNALACVIAQIARRAAATDAGLRETQIERPWPHLVSKVRLGLNGQNAGRRIDRFSQLRRPLLAVAGVRFGSEADHSTASKMAVRSFAVTLRNLSYRSRWPNVLAYEV